MTTTCAIMSVESEESDIVSEESADAFDFQEPFDWDQYFSLVSASSRKALQPSPIKSSQHVLGSSPGRDSLGNSPRGGGGNLNDTSVWTTHDNSAADMSMESNPGLSQQYRPQYHNHPNHNHPNHRPNPGPHPTSVLRSYEDFENAKVFDAQLLLEERHREEEERLIRFLLEEREKELHRLDDTVEDEKERAAEDLLASIENLSLNSVPRSLVAERDRIEDHFTLVKEERLKAVTEKIALEEKTRNGKMIDRHCHEMLTLLGEKDREIDRMCLFDHSMKPPAEPPEGKKATLYKSPTVFESIDLRAIEYANRDYETFTDLVRDLTKPCRTELEKARILFRWIIAKDVNKHTVNEIVRPHAMDRLLKGVKSGKETYHQLYKKLCSYAGLHCEVVLGYSKGAGYKPGMRMDGQAFRNSWTVVNVEGSWRLVNTTWGARHVTGHKDNLPPMYTKYDEFYFLTDPEDHIYQHYPDDPRWQLLEIPLPFSEFLNLPVVKSPFFNYGLRFYSNYGATLTTETGMVEMRLLTQKILGFGSMLEPVHRLPNEPRQIEGRTLLRFVKNEAIFTIALPAVGYYYFSVYTGDYWKSECLESASTFLIHCKNVSGAPSPPYPPVPFFGPTPVMEELGISADSHVDPLVVCNNDYIEINFVLNRDIRLTHTFQYYDVSDGAITDIDRYVFLRSRNDKGANYLIRCPREGFFIFSLFAADLSADAKALDCAFRYLVICQEPSPTVAKFPKTYQKWHRCSLHEPLTGDLVADKHVMFRLDVPQALEMFVVIGDVWHHLKRKVGSSWEGHIHTGSVSCTAKVYARFEGATKDQSLFCNMLDYEVVEDNETEI